MTIPIDIANDLGKKYLNKNLSRQILIIMFIIILFFGLISFLFYNTISKIQVLSSDTIDLFNDREVLLPSTNINTKKHLRETYILYLSLDNSNGSGLFYRNFKKNKTILRRDNKDLEILYNPHQNCLNVQFKIMELEIANQDNDGTFGIDNLQLLDNYDIVNVCDIPFQKWFQLVIVINNREVDIYIDKSLRKTQILKNVPKLSDNSLILGEKGNNPNLFVGRVEYVPDIINNNEINALYFKNMPFLKINRELRDKINYEAHNKNIGAPE